MISKSPVCIGIVREVFAGLSVRGNVLSVEPTLVLIVVVDYLRAFGLNWGLDRSTVGLHADHLIYSYTDSYLRLVLL